MDNSRSEAIVVEGKNPEEALQAACDRLKTTPNQVEYEVVEGGRPGVFGFLKGRTVKVRVWKKSATQRMIAELVQGLFTRMGVETELKVTQADDGYDIELASSDADGLLIGRGGETLKALQHIVSRMVGQKDEELRVRLDVAGYRKRRHDQLRRKAKDLAERALSTHRDALTEPLPADERRIVHMALAEDGRVETHALGDGQVKRVAISPLAGARATGGDRPARGRSRGGRAEGEGAGERRSPSSHARRSSSSSDRAERSDRSTRSDRPERRERSDRPERSDRYARPGRPSRGRGRGSREEGESSGVRHGRSTEGSREAVMARSGAEGRPPRRSPATRWDADVTRDDEAEVMAATAAAAAAATPAPDETPVENGGEEKYDHRRPRRRSLPSANESYFTIPETVEEPKEPSDEAQPEDDSAAPLTWGRKRRAARGRR